MYLRISCHDLFINLDTDECAQELDECDHNCTNTIGSYICTCMAGYMLQADNYNCTGNKYKYDFSL